jgi:hypothetical protein
MINAGFVGYQPWRVNIADQPHGFARDWQTAFHLGAHRHESQISPQGFSDVTIVFVTAVEPDFIAEQTGTDADGDFVIEV